MPGEVFLRGDRIDLCTIEDEDSDHLQRGRNDPDVRRLSGGPPEPFDEHDTEGYLEWLRDDDTVALAIVADGEYVGMVTLRDIRRPDDVGTAGVKVVQDAQGNGYATEACSLLFDYGFDQLGLNKIAANVFAFNEPSQALVESLGLTLEGTIREERYADGGYHDVYRYGLLAREWRANR